MQVDSFKEVCVVGLGYIGLPTASLLASRGFMVYGLDISSDVVETINRGEIHIIEPELDVIVRSAVFSGNLKAGLSAKPADVFMIAVPTPLREDKTANTDFIEDAVRNIAPVLAAGNLIILESTSPVGTTERVQQWILEQRPDLESDGIYLAHCPERVLPGRIVHELIENDRLVGGINSESTKVAGSFYGRFVAGEVIHTDARTAELAKLAENTFRDVNIALANELSLICESFDINIWELISLTNRHPRVNILNPGPGVGGHCIAVDPWFIVNSAPEQSNLIRKAREVNEAKPGYVVEQINNRIRSINKANITITLLGLSYKPDIDDLRESPALYVAEKLSLLSNATIIVVEPNIDDLPASLAAENVRKADLSEAFERCDIVVALVPHREFIEVRDVITNYSKFMDFCGLLR